MPAQSALSRVPHGRCYRKFDRSELLSQRSYSQGNFFAERYFFLKNIIAARKFDRSLCIGAGTGPAGPAMAGPFSAEVET